MIPLEKSTNIANINLAPVYNKFQVYYQQEELGPETELEILIADPESVNMSEDKYNTNGKSDPKVALKESEAPNQFSMNVIK